MKNNRVTLMKNYVVKLDTGFCDGCDIAQDDISACAGRICKNCRFKGITRCPHCLVVFRSTDTLVTAFQGQHEWAEPYDPTRCAAGHDHDLCRVCHAVLGDLCPDSDTVVAARILRKGM